MARQVVIEGNSASYKKGVIKVEFTQLGLAVAGLDRSLTKDKQPGQREPYGRQ